MLPVQKCLSKLSNTRGKSNVSNIGGYVEARKFDIPVYNTVFVTLYR